MRALAWMLLLVLVVACGKHGPPLRHPPQPRQARGAAATPPATQVPAAPEAPTPEATDPAAPATEDTQP